MKKFILMLSVIKTTYSSAYMVIAIHITHVDSGKLKWLAFIYQVYIFQDHVMGFCVFAEAKQAHNVGVIQFTEHVDLPPELSLRELVTV